MYNLTHGLCWYCHEQKFYINVNFVCVLEEGVILNTAQSLSLPLSLPAGAGGPLRLHAACEAAARLLAACVRWTLSVPAAAAMPLVHTHAHKNTHMHIATDTLTGRVSQVRGASVPAAEVLVGAVRAGSVSLVRGSVFGIPAADAGGAPASRAQGKERAGTRGFT